MFQTKENRYASVGIVAKLPDSLIDQIWWLIDHDLQGLVPLDNLLIIDLINRQGKLTLSFVQKQHDLTFAIDLTDPYLPDYPQQILAYDDRTDQTILLPSEVN